MRILVVEDEQQVREELAELLELHGLDVEAFDRVSSAMLALRQAIGPLILLTDLRLPDGSGLDIIQEIHNDPVLASSVARIIVMTGHTDITEQLARTLERQDIALLFKPLDTKALIDMLTVSSRDD